MNLTLLLYFILGWYGLAYPHGGSVSQEPWRVCENVKIGNACEYKNHHGDLYKGTCRIVSQNSICVRNQPIVKAKEVKTPKKVKEKPVEE